MPTWTTEQLNAFRSRGKQQPSAATGVDNESELHALICDECRRRGWLAFHGAMAKPTHRTMGEPDFVILASGGRLLMVECKTRTGKQSPEQLAIAAHAEMLGHVVHVVRSFDEFLKVAKA